MKIRLTLLLVGAAIISAGGVWAGDLTLSTDPNHPLITIGAKRYVVAKKDDQVSFSASPSTTLDTLSWTFVNGTPGTGTGNGPIPVTYAAHAEGKACAVKFTSSRSETDSDGNPIKCSTTGKTTVAVLVPKFITPAGDGDPKASPVDGGFGTGTVTDGANEFTFSTAPAGVLTLQLKVKIGSGVESGIVDHLLFGVDGIGNSTLAWHEDNPGGKPKYGGEYLTANLTFTNLPANNSDFGAKVARLMYSGSAVATASFEVFFQRDASNHPEGGSPNWFYYWNQSDAGYVEAAYFSIGNDVYGQTPAMRFWSPQMTHSKSIVWISDPSVGSSIRRDGSDEEVTGIDLFANVVKHEVRHTQQITEADNLLGALLGKPSTVWAKGWSWRPPGKNHIILGPDGKAGFAGVDDDKDGTVDEENDMSEIGFPNSDDINLDLNNDNVGDTLPYSHVEIDAQNHENSPEDTHSASDWGNPGKQHQDIDYDN